MMSLPLLLSIKDIGILIAQEFTKMKNGLGKHLIKYSKLENINEATFS
jgi:hypothetical protein